MSQYNEQYYIIFESYDENTLYLKTHEHSSIRDYEYTKLTGSEPMFFENGYREQDIVRGIRRPIKNAHLDSTYPVVSNEIKQSFGYIENPCFQFYPAVIVDDSGDYHEDFWVFNVFQKMDVLDMGKCSIMKFNPNREGQKILQYHFDDKKMDGLPLSERLVIKPKFSNIGHIIVHESIVKVFKKHNVDTLNFVKVSEWEMGKQFVE